VAAISRRDFVRTFVASSFAAGALNEARAATPRSVFGAQSTAEEVTAGLDLRGKTAVVTGCNSGIGFETMRVLALRGAHVIGTARTRQKGEEACAQIKGRTTCVVLELTDFDSVVECSRQIRALRVPLDMLILNAGIVLGEIERVYGLEKQFVVNHLGHFVLANRLMDLVQASPQGRVVTVGSGNHRDAPPDGIQFGRLSGEGWYKRGYAHSKLANGLFSLELARRFTGTRATSNCITPGPVKTQILRYVDSSTDHQTKSPAQGAATQCYVATHPTLAGVSGEYFKDCNPAAQSEHQQDVRMAAKLWQVSTELTARYLA
jgi:NAD(P)-dependent dehydrogenase (short-subunit alcohol dehydrogenase family)